VSRYNRDVGIFFCIEHVPRERNRRANALAQQASGYEVTTKMLVVMRSPAMRVSDHNNNESANGAQEQQQASVRPIEKEEVSSNAGMRRGVMGTSVGSCDTCNHRGKSGELSNKAHSGIAGEEANMQGSSGINQKGPEAKAMKEINHGDWKAEILKYLKNPSNASDWKV
jgi:hypothetical protein